jgi:hypothetical protein
MFFRRLVTNLSTSQKKRDDAHKDICAAYRASIATKNHKQEFFRRNKIKKLNNLDHSFFLNQTDALKIQKRQIIVRQQLYERVKDIYISRKSWIGYIQARFS